MFPIFTVPHIVEKLLSPSTGQVYTIAMTTGGVLPTLRPWSINNQFFPRLSTVNRPPHVIFALKRIICSRQDIDNIIKNYRGVTISSRPAGMFCHLSP